MATSPSWKPDSTRDGIVLFVVVVDPALIIILLLPSWRSRTAMEDILRTQAKLGKGEVGLCLVLYIILPDLIDHLKVMLETNQLQFISLSEIDSSILGLALPPSIPPS